jgi:alpha-tubulin suppressor-like RCC1 family protein
LKSDGTVFAWGTNYWAELGQGYNANLMEPAQVEGLTNVIAISAGSYSHSMALKSDATLWAWGLNSSGQLGIGTLVEVNLPTQVTSLSNVISIAGANGHSLAVLEDGTAWAWGWNLYGQLVNGNNIDSNVPVQVSGLSGMVEVAGGRNHSVASKNDGSVWVWGENSVGQLANNEMLTSNIPLQVENLCLEIISVGEKESPIEVSVFSNPIISDITIRGTKANGVITIFDSTGSIFLRERTLDGLTTVNAISLSSGIYLVNYFHGNNIENVRFLKL